MILIVFGLSDAECDTAGTFPQKGKDFFSPRAEYDDTAVGVDVLQPAPVDIVRAVGR